MTVICKVENCPETARGAGWCMTHYQRWRRHGDPEGWSPCVAPNCEERRAEGRNWCPSHVEENENKTELPFWHYEARGTLEFDVALELIDRLRGRGYLVRPEFHIPGSGLRVDIAIWARPDERPFLVEVKKDVKTYERYDRSGRQRQRYVDWGWPFCFCFGMEGIESTLRAVDRWAELSILTA